ncbi:hypothetical protein ATO12_22765 [Aquimarina atlantica]|uniref:UDP-glucose/GDP-mannose dehydrogenase C-terminal domain-containing protein n=1 Tax=Aquimarina atlantica TaxID=1317122 RepID=A0A023BQD8_9FLAO|nr:UDP binding domain-containing protein [Aquimarina atlantica]EZH72277.1 hypothetical protein ATO12_22765 [Aquimarina atlantica]
MIENKLIENEIAIIGLGYVGLPLAVEFGKHNFNVIGYDINSSKENCPDIRNSKVIDVINELKEFGVEVEIYDPHADHKEVKKEYNVDLINEPKRKYDTIILTVGHDELKRLNINELSNTSVMIYDVKSFFPKELITDRL